MIDAATALHAVKKARLAFAYHVITQEQYGAVRSAARRFLSPRPYHLGRFGLPHHRLTDSAPRA